MTPISTILRLAGLAAVLASGLIGAGAAVADDLAAFKAAIRHQYDLREQAFNRKDLAAIVDHFYTEDPISVSPGEVTEGRSALLKAYQAHSQMKIHIVSYKSHLQGTSGVDWANFYYTPDDPTQKPGVLQMLFLWERRHGRWVCIGDMWVPGEFPIPHPESSSAH